MILKNFEILSCDLVDLSGKTLAKLGQAAVRIINAGTAHESHWFLFYWHAVTKKVLCVLQRGNSLLYHFSSPISVSVHNGDSLAGVVEDGQVWAECASVSVSLAIVGGNHGDIHREWTKAATDERLRAPRLEGRGQVSRPSGCAGAFTRSNRAGDSSHNDLLYHGGKTIQSLTFMNFYVVERLLG